jgi:ribosome biogenesis GTPase A
VGRKRGGLLPGGRVNLQKAAEVVLNDFRASAWGPITLETPEQFALWAAAGEAAEAARAAKQAARKAGRKDSRQADAEARRAWVQGRGASADDEGQAGD